MKHTKQKDLIYNAVIENHCHPTANFIYNYLKTDNPNLSLATVYRNLNRFAEKGKILKLNLPNDSIRFDGRLTKHFHAICERCGEVFDIEPDKLDIVDNQKLSLLDFEVRDYSLIIYVVCKNCLG